MMLVVYNFLLILVVIILIVLRHGVATTKIVLILWVWHFDDSEVTFYQSLENFPVLNVLQQMLL